MPRMLAILLLGWAIAFFGSFLAFYLTPARDFGLSAGWNKVGIFMQWQAVATGLALGCLAVRWTSKDKITRRFAALPSVALGVMLAALAAVLLWASFQRTSPDPGPALPSKPVTAPAVEE